MSPRQRVVTAPPEGTVMKPLNKRATALAAALALAILATPSWADTVRLHGAASVVDSLVSPNKVAVEKATGDTLVIDRSNAGKGLIDLVDGKADAALASAEIPTLVAAAKAAGREVDPAKLVMTVVATDQVVFVVHPSNRVQRLTNAQLRDIHAGRIANWKDVGGEDRPIKVVTDTASSATRGLIKQAILKDADYVPTALAVNVGEISDEVAKDPGAIGGLGAGFVKKDKVVVVAADKIERPLGLVTIGPPDAKVQRVITALKTAAAQ
jgi:phosphate transport system substrate-binding protein